MEKLLSELAEKVEANVVCLLEKDKALFSRLEEYGFVPGEKTRIIKKFKGILLVSLRGVLLSIDTSTAKRIVVCD